MRIYYAKMHVRNPEDVGNPDPSLVDYDFGAWA